MKTALEQYLRGLAVLRSSGATVEEVSYHSVLAVLLDTIGNELKPKVKCVPELANTGLGRPDLGLYTTDQLRRQAVDKPVAVKPERGVVEIKSPKESLASLTTSAQVKGYLVEYGLVLATNYREFAIVSVDGEKLAVQERYSLAADEATFWAICSAPENTVERQTTAFSAFLKRALQYTVPLVDPKDVAAFLAAYAQEAMARIMSVNLPALASVQRSLEDALDLEFTGDKGDVFFRSTLIQTLFYGIFSAWVLWQKQQPGGSNEPFTWRQAAWSLNVPVIQALFEQIAAPSKLGPLNLVEILDWTEKALNRIDRTIFFQRIEADNAVQHFYEPFLEAFAPNLRKQLGVWYTPNEIVKYMVARVDHVLRTELGLEDGLADPNVYVLDPCVGTGSFLVEVLRTVHTTLSRKGQDALTGEETKRAAMSRIIGFEILPAPLAVAHLQLGLMLQSMGTTLTEGERFQVYLTNALTGWEPLEKAKRQLGFEDLNPIVELETERKAAGRVKQDVPILVIIGNPPYSAYAGVAQQEEQGLISPYKQGLIKQWGVKKFNLDELYVRFFGIAQRRIAKTGRGVVCFISNFSYLGDRSFVGLRYQLLREFDRLWFDSLNGDSRETGKRTPEGAPDPSVFSTEYNRDGIRVGTAVALWVKSQKSTIAPVVRTRELWGTTKRKDLLESLEAPQFDEQYRQVHPSEGTRYSFRKSRKSQYEEWPCMLDICRVSPSNGLMEKRGGSLIDIDKGLLEQRMRAYYDRDTAWESIRHIAPSLARNAARFDAIATRTKVLNRETFNPEHLRPYYIRPFDRQWCYYSSVRPLWNECRPKLWKQSGLTNGFVVSRVATDKKNEGFPVFFVRGLLDDHLLSPDASAFPIQLHPPGTKTTNPNQTELFERANDIVPSANLSEAAHKYLYNLGVYDPDVNTHSAALIWMHSLAITYSPRYLRENAENLPFDWPRVPLPDSHLLLESSADLGERVANLLDLECNVTGVTAGTIRDELALIAVVSKEGGGNLTANDLQVMAGWGRTDSNGVVMPGRGRVVPRDYTDSELELIKRGATRLGIGVDEVLGMLGSTTVDVYLNDSAYWKAIPSRVWDTTIGGYQVLKKWLSYREATILNRALTVDETRNFRDIARRIAAVLLMSQILDSNYLLAKASACKWETSGQEPEVTLPDESKLQAAPTVMLKQGSKLTNRKGGRTSP